MKPRGLLHDGLGVLHRQSAVHGRRVTVCLIRVRVLKVLAIRACSICFPGYKPHECGIAMYPRLVYGRRSRI